MKNKKVEKVIYSLMTLIVLIQSLVPMIAIAETLNDAVVPVTIKKAELIKSEDQTLNLNIAGEVTDQQGTAIVKTLSIVEGTKFLPEASQTLGLGSSTYEVTADALIFKLAANDQGQFTLTAKVDPTTVKQSLTLKIDQQTVNVALSSSDTDSSTSDTDTSAVSDSSVASEASTESSTEAVEDSTQAAAEATTALTDQPKADTGNDIRDYFPGGEGTIIDGVTVTYYDQDGNELQPPVPADAEVKIHYDWSIPEDVRQQIKPGDQFTFQLPEGVKPKAGQSGELKGPDGNVYATYEVDENGQVVMTFTDNVTKEIDINGTFDFSTEFDLAHIDGPGDHQITFPTEDNLPPVDVTIRPATDTAIAKSGHFDRTPNPTEVTWDVDFNQGMNALTDPTITEKWPDGLIYQSVKVYELVMNLDGTVKEVGRELSPDEYTVDANGNVTIKGDTSNAYRVEYVTSIDEDAIPDQGGSVSFVNTATLTDKDNPDGLDAEASVTNTFGKMIEKNQVGYDPDDQTFFWEIKYNYGEKHIQKDDAVITDDMSSNMSLSNDPVIYPITFGPNGEEIQGGTPLVVGVDYVLEKNPNGPGFVIRFLHDIDSAYKITYQTKVNGTITDPTAVDNKVEVGTGESGSDSGTAQQQNVIKSLDKNSIDYQNKTVDWVIEVNKNHYEMHNLVLTDTFSPVPGLELQKIPDLNGFHYAMTIISSDGIELVQGVDYSIEPTYNDQHQQTGYVLKFLNDYNPTSDSFTVRYTTSFDIEALDPNDPNLDHFANDISADWTSKDGENHHSEDHDEFKPKPSFTLNAQKSGAYNAQTKTITWSIAVNLSGNLLEDAFLTDQIKDNQAYVPGTLKVYEAHTNKNGTVAKDDEADDNAKMTEVTEPAADDTFTIRFPDESQHTYIIEFETSLVGQVIDASKEYDNHATYSNKGRDRDVVGKVTIKNGGTHMQKSGEQDANNPDYVNWHLTINAAQSVLNNVVVTDKPSNNQIVDQNSIKLYETSVAVDGTITPDKSKPLTEGVDYTLSVTTDNVTGDQVITVTFLHEISSAYYMEYRALINSSATGQNDKVSNEASITGEGTKTVTGEDGEDVIVQIDHSGGTASGKKGSITLRKTNEDKTVFLTGAHFQLWDAGKTQILREGDVDASGEITFGNLQLGDYLLIETVAPDGYTIPDDLVQGRTITITAATSAEMAAPTDIVNTPNKVILTKTGEHQEKLAKAEFRLEQQVGSVWLDVTPGPLVTDANGILTINSLPLGHYRITETKAPAGYLINTRPIEFTVSKTSQNQIPTIDLAMTDYQGSAFLMKYDSEDNPLAGAIFKIVDSQGKTVKDNLMSAADGKVYADGLAPGDYFFVETQAPTGYVLNTQKYPFTIVDRTVDKPVVVEAGQAYNYKGSAELIKKDESGKTLAGAIFKVIDKNGQDVQTNLVSDTSGKVTVTDLAPGDYQFVETQAPDGYILNTKKLTFTINAATEGKPVTVQVGTITNYQGSVILHKVNTAHEPLAGAEFTLYDDQRNERGKAVSGADGLISFDQLAPGTYFLIETQAPKLPDGTDYVINPYPIIVVIPAETADEPVEIELGEFQNFKGKAEIQKIGANGSIAGAEFALYGIINGEETFLKTIVVPDSGILPIDELGAGQYKLVETKAAPGYIINNQPIYFVVDTDIVGDIDHFDFENYQSEIIGQKVDGDGLTADGLAGAEFQIYEQNPDGSKGNRPVTFMDSQGQMLDTIVTDADGKLYAAGLSIGNYLLVETKAPAGYALDTTEHPFEVTEQTGKPDPIDLGEINNYRGKIDITKSSDQEELLSGGTFVLATDKDGKNPVSVMDINGKEAIELHAVNGHIQAEGIQPGTYYLVETEAPTGYIVNTEPIEVVIPEAVQGTTGLTIGGNLVNYQGSVIMTKVDDQGNALAGAEFKIADAAGKTIQKGITSDEQGLVKADGLAPGDYQLIETKAPNGYQLSQMVRTFTIEATVKGEPSIVNAGKFVNKKIPTKHPTPPGNSQSQSAYPKTNDQTNNLFGLIGLLMIGTVGIIWWRRAR